MPNEVLPLTGLATEAAHGSSSAPCQAHLARHRVAVSRDLPGLAAAWTDLEARAGATAFQSHAWCSAWTAAAAGQRRFEPPFVVTIFEGERLLLAWPLAVRRVGPFRVLVNLGDPATQCGDALVEPGPEAGALLDAAWAVVTAARAADAVFVKGVRSDAAIAGLPPLAGAGG